MKTKKTKLILAMCLGACMGFAQNPFTTGYNLFLGNAAGGGTQGTTVQGGVAVGNPVSRTGGIVVNSKGETFIADQGNNVVVKVDIFGVATIIAGVNGGTGGYNGDGAAAVHTLLNNPTTLALDLQGNLYINDWGNGLIRKVNAISGTINSGTAHLMTTVAGTVPAPYTGVTFGTKGPIVKCTQDGGAVCGDGGPASSATFYGTSGIAVDNYGNIFIIDSGVIREVTVGTTDIFGNTTTPGYIYTVVGQPGVTPYGNPSTGNNVLANSSAVVINPTGAIAFDATYSNLYFTDLSNGLTMDPSTIRRVDLTNPTYKGRIYYFAGYGVTPGTSADGYPVTSIPALATYGASAMAIDANNNIYLALFGNLGNIGLFTNTGNYYTLFTNIIQENGIAVDACGNLYFNYDAGVLVYKAINGVVPSFAPNLTVPAQLCSGSTLNIGGTTGTTIPDSYILNIISANSSLVADGGPGLTATISNPTSTTIAYSFATSSLPCNHNYIVQITETKKCPVLTNATYTTSIYINCNPAASISGNTTICSGTSTTLCVSPSGSPYNIAWFTRGLREIVYSTQPCITESPTTNTTYDVTVTNSTTGCATTLNQLVTVSPNVPSFNLSDVTSNSAYATISALASDAATTASAGYAYEYILSELSSPSGSANWTVSNNPSNWWLFPSATTFSGINNSGSTDYSGSVTVPNVSTPGEFHYARTYMITLGSWNNVCPWAQSSQIITLPLTGGKEEQSTIIKNATAPDFSYLQNQVSSTAGINNLVSNAAQQFEIYPNPNNGNFTIETQTTTPQLVEMFDLTGRLVLSQTINGTTNVNVSNVTNGIYNIKISANDNVVNKRIVITK
jgi:hypothetical protein